ncbi:hypothetical protein MRB53_031097 [Persea americana]|uniref:Uncharacterized protein n=1 Tax=Persea americana TaxID=3435 RepID=A0ACC2KN49_PERAE|nr:hypothetical protein MRB53_031097 [Persea americana]
METCRGFGFGWVRHVQDRSDGSYWTPATASLPLRPWCSQQRHATASSGVLSPVRNEPSLLHRSPTDLKPVPLFPVTRVRILCFLLQRNGETESSLLFWRHAVAAATTSPSMWCPDEASSARPDQIYKPTSSEFLLFFDHDHRRENERKGERERK